MPNPFDPEALNDSLAQFQENERNEESSVSDRLKQSCIDVLQTTAKIVRLEDELKAAKSEIHILTTKDIPELMAEMGNQQAVKYEEFSVSLSEKYHGSLPKDHAKRAVALQHIEELGGGGIMKTKVECFIPPSDHDMISNVTEAIEEQGFTPEVSKDINHATLKKFVREQREDGKPIEPGKVGVFVQNTASVRLKK